MEHDLNGKEEAKWGGEIIQVAFIRQVISTYWEDAVTAGVDVRICTSDPAFVG